jgi:serine/threonine-protein phosphatase PP1 catalytic subunit
MSSQLGNRRKSLINLKRNTSQQESIKRSQSCGNIKDKGKSSIKKQQVDKVGTNDIKTYDTPQKFNCFDTFVKYLIAFNKLETNMKTKLKKENPTNNYNDINYRINIPIKIIETICLKTYKLFSNEPNLLDIKGPLYIFGDIHGQYCDLLRFIEIIGLPPKSKFLFLGDYVDRGDNSIEVITLLFSLKIKFPNQIYLLRGNHECSSVNDMYGFKDECIERYKGQGEYIWMEINKTLRMLPVCALVNKKIFCTHAGISPQLESLSQINKLNRNVEIPEKGILCDLTWSDPKKQRNKWVESDRGVSYTFNEDAVDQFIKKMNIDLIVRAHQVVDEGHQFFNGQKLVTVFSAPNYCGQVGNQASVMKIKSNLECSFITLKPVNKKKKKQQSLSLLKQ